MNKETSFKYVFFDLVKELNEIEVAYQHEAIPIFQEYQPIPTGESKWELTLFAFSKKYKQNEYQKNIASKINSITQYIEDRRNELHSFLEYFLNRIISKRDKLKDFYNLEISLTELVEEKIIKLKYLGYLPYGENYSMLEMGAKLPKSKNPEGDEYNYNKIDKIIIPFIEILIDELDKLVLFLFHEQNIYLERKEKLKNENVGSELLTLLQKGKIHELINSLKSNPNFNFDQEFIQTSARFYILEKDKNNDTISRDEYNRQISKIIEAFINLVSKEK